ncbi:MAG: PSD1 and planctomycete cytochrome C domain-containing protein, partial [Aeoliella sp.]
MPVSVRRAGCAVLLLAPFAVYLSTGVGGSALSSDVVSFRRDVLPILSNTCFQCHGPDEANRQADLRLDTQSGATDDRGDGAAIVPGDPEASQLVARITSQDADVRMPPADSLVQLKPHEIATLRQWVLEGAQYEAHWSFIAPRRTDSPPVKLQDWVRNPIDAFVLARLESEGLTPSPEADRTTLIRRISLDLTGLPPTSAEIEAFVQDGSLNSYEKVVERLLSSPHYGERMAWDWLDAARYADSNGYQGDNERTMWPWRDWVVDAFNRNMPFDQFTIWQLAGDLLPEATFEQRLATGFCRNHMINGEGGRIAEENRVEYVFDMTETMGTVWLGLTLTCCRCHDHKFDPLTRREYYQFFAFFNQTPVDGGGGDPYTAPALACPSTEQQQQLSDVDRQLKAAVERQQHRAAELSLRQPAWEAEQRTALGNDPDQQELRETLAIPADERSQEQNERVVHAHQESDETLCNLRDERERLDQHRATISNGIPKVMIMGDRPELRATFMLERGLYNNPNDEVTAAVPAGFAPMPSGASANRLGLSQWLVSDDHPLTARVTVNRFWQQIFGVGLVKTAEDFGVQGEIPIHQDLLDWLAVEFRESDWDMKALVRLIVTSATYR